MIEPRHLDAEQLSSLIDGRLEAAERGGAEAHLAGCERCRAARESLSATVALLRGLPAVEPPRSFLLPPTIQAPIELAERRPLLERLAPWTRAAGALAAALFVVLVSVDVIGGMGAQAPMANHESAAAPAKPAAEKPAEAAKPAAAPKPAEAAKPAPTSAPAARPAAPAAAPAAAPQAQDRADDSAKPAGAAAPQPTQAAPASAAAAASPAAAARPAASPAAAPARAAEPTVAESAAAGPTPIPPGFVATVPTPPPTATLQPTPRSTPSSGPALVQESASLRPWQVVSGLLAVTLLLASFLLPRLNRWLRAQ